MVKRLYFRWCSPPVVKINPDSSVRILAAPRSSKALAGSSAHIKGGLTEFVFARPNWNSTIHTHIVPISISVSITYLCTRSCKCKFIVVCYTALVRWKVPFGLVTPAYPPWTLPLPPPSPNPWALRKSFSQFEVSH